MYLAAGCKKFRLEVNWRVFPFLERRRALQAKQRPTPEISSAGKYKKAFGHVVPGARKKRTSSAVKGYPMNDVVGFGRHTRPGLSIWTRASSKFSVTGAVSARIGTTGCELAVVASGLGGRTNQSLESPGKVRAERRPVQSVLVATAGPGWCRLAIGTRNRAGASDFEFVLSRLFFVFAPFPCFSSPFFFSAFIPSV